MPKSAIVPAERWQLSTSTSFANEIGIATAHLPREERFARRGQVDLYVASTAANKLKTNDDRLWLPAFELGVKIGAKAAPEIGKLPLRGPWTRLGHD